MHFFKKPNTKEIYAYQPKGQPVMQAYIDSQEKSDFIAL